MVGKPTPLEIRKLVVRDWDNGLSVKELAEKYGLSVEVARRIVKRRGVFKKSGRRRDYDLREDYFEIIDSPSKAYFLGFMYADGTVYGKYNIGVCLKEEDKYWLRMFADELNVPYRKILRHEVNGKNYPRLIFQSKKMVEDLEKLGCIHRKSWKLKFKPDIIPEKYYSHFWRGMVDGDGSFNVYQKVDRIYLRLEFCGTKDIVRSFAEYLDIGNWKIRKRKSANFYTVEFTLGTLEKLEVVRRKLYENCGKYYLKRKREIFSRYYSLKKLYGVVRDRVWNSYDVKVSRVRQRSLLDYAI